MLAYAAHRRTRRHLSPPTLIGIVAVHAAAITILALAKTEIVRIPPVITEVFPVTPEKDPPPEPVPPRPVPQAVEPTPPTSHIETVKPIVDSNPQPTVPVDTGPSTVDVSPRIGPSIDPVPQPVPQPTPVAQPTSPVLLTSGDALRPPYPEEKRRLEEEAVLRLRLAIDPRGRVTAVDPIGGADPLFLASARNHLLRAWRYRPATEAGQPVATSIVVTLRFRLDQE